MKRRLLPKSRTRAISLPFFQGRLGSAFFLFISLFLMIVSLVNPSGFSGVRTFASDLSSSFIQTVNQPLQKAAFFVRDVSGLAQMQQMNQTLEQENIRLRSWYQTAMTLEDENKALKKLLNMKTSPNIEYVSGQVFSDPGQAYVQSALIDVGRSHGVSVGGAVLSAQGLVGRIVEAGQKTARILLLTDVNSRVPVMVEGHDVRAILTGSNDGVPELKHLPEDIQIKDGARVVTSGHGGMFPKGLPVGIVKNMQGKNPSVTSFANFDALLYVRVLKTEEGFGLNSGGALQ